MPEETTNAKPQETGGIRGWLFRVAARKVTTRVVILVSSYLFTVKTIAILNSFGVTVDPEKFQIEANVAVYAGLEIARDWAKLKFGIRWL